MNIRRRDILKVLTALPIMSAGVHKMMAQDDTSTQNSIAIDPTPLRVTIAPKALAKGSVVAITAPSSATNETECLPGMKYFKNMGCKLIIGDTVRYNKTKYRYLSAPDEVRAEEFMKFAENPDIDCIIAARGGFGTIRILNMLDYSVIAKNPKLYIGFSDITSLLLSIYRMTGIGTFHGPVASSSFNQFTSNYLTKFIFKGKGFTPIKITHPQIKTIVKGKGTGRLVGGNLSMVTSLLGTPFEPDLRESILFIEEVAEEPYKVDRMFSQLILSGKLQQCKGIVIGYIKNIDTKRNFYPGYSYTIREIIAQRIVPLGIPCVLGMPFGHCEDNLTLPIGTLAELDATTLTLKILDPPVEG